MKKIFYTILLLSFCLQLTFAQKDRTASAGPIPKMKIEQNHKQVSTTQNKIWGTAYGFSNIQNYTLSMPIPAGTPFTLLSSWTPPVFASSMVNQPWTTYYYITELGPPPALYEMDSETGIVTLVGNITGMYDQPNGISYNSANGHYYIISSTNLYSFDPLTLNATLIGPLNTFGLMIDLCFDWSGVCYAYDISTDNAYKINLSTGNATLLGALGFDANFGQGMSYDYETSTIYLSAFNFTTMTGQLRTMDPVTGMTTLITDWGIEQIAPFSLPGLPCMSPVGQASNPSPPWGATNIPISGTTLSWTNGVYTINVEIWFGVQENVVKVYDGPAITSWALDTLLYGTQYRWKIICKDTTCGESYSPSWIFTTEQDPNLVQETVDIFPMNVNYWSGTCNLSTKTQESLVNAFELESGWMVFDLSPIVNDPSTEILNITFNGYLYADNWPYWSITPMGGVYPVTADAATIYNQISAGYNQGTAYSFNQEAGTLTNDWIQRNLEANALTDMKNVLDQGWFAIGFVDWDFSQTFFIEFHGWAEANKPYLTVTYTYAIPVELLIFTAEVDENVVTLLWQTATETNNSGFEVERSQMSKVKSQTEWKRIGFVEGKGTTTEIQSYSFTDKTEPGKYKYRLKQIDFDGSFEYSQEIEAEVKAPNVFSLDQNFPNPFNPSTMISYQIPVNGNVTLKVYDILGNEVATLVDEYQQPGKYEVEFSAKGGSAYGGNAYRLPSGIYFYQLKAGNFIETKKMILLK
jgi:hypothetical protein